MRLFTVFCILLCSCAPKAIHQRSRLLAVSSTYCTTAQVNAFGFSGGDGRASDPFIICLPSQMALVNTHRGAHFKLGWDINMSGITHQPIGTASGFYGVFDGNGYTITNLSVSVNAQRGALFAQVNGGLIKNLTVQGSVTANFTSESGGIVGYANNSNLQLLRFVGTVNSDNNNYGGIVGYAVNTSIVSCSSSATITTTAGGTAGVLVGRLDGGSIQQSYGTGAVVATGNANGGVVGAVKFGGVVSDTYFTGTVTGADVNGGIAGQISNDVGTEYVTKSYAEVTINCTAANLSNGYIVGIDFVGTTTADTTNMRSSISTNNVCGAVNAVGTSKTPAQLKQAATFTGAGWNFTSVWSILENISYPTLRSAR